MADLSAVAVWTPPVAEQPAAHEGHADADAPPAARLFADLDAARPAGAHWTLEFLGAREDGGGRASALVRHRLDLVGATAPARLWTSLERSVAFYERLGFAVTSRHDVPGATAWWMVRPAETASSARTGSGKGSRG